MKMGRMILVSERPLYERYSQRVIGSSITYFFEYGCEVHMPENSRATKPLIPLTNFEGVCGVCKRFGLLTHMVLLRDGKVDKHHVAHVFNECDDPYEYERVVVKYREDLNDVFLSSHREMDVAMEKVIEQRNRRFRISEVG